MEKTWKEFLAEKGHETIDNLSAGDLANLHNEFVEAKNKALEEAIESKASAEDIATMKADMEKSRAEEVRAIYAAMKAISLENKGSVEPLTARGSLVKQLKENLSEIKDIAKGTSSKEIEIEIKAITNLASVSGNDAAFDLTDLGQLAHDKLTTFDIFAKLPISDSQNIAATIKYWDWDSTATVRNAGTLAESATFPESTARWIQKTIPIRKIGDSLPVTEEFFEDEQLFAAELDFFLRTNVDIVTNGQVLNGDGTGTELTGLVTSSDTYTPAAAGITDASIYDLIVKVSEDITDGGGAKYTPNFAVLNIADINQMKLKKDANNNYIMPPFVSRDGKVVAGMTIIEDNATVANTMVVGDSRFARIYERKGVEISRGFVGSQFVEDAMTLKARRRIAFLMRFADTGGFRKVTSISAALTTLATP